MAKLYTRPKQYSLSRVGLEIYETDEENFEPYISSGLVSATKSTSSKSTTTSEDSEDTEAVDTTVEEDTEEDDKGFKLHQGEIKTKFLYANNITSTSHEQDYKEMANNGSLKMDKVNKRHAYKGVRLCMKKEWEETGKKLKWDDLPETLLGFITEQTYREEGVELKISGMSTLLDQKFKFKFSNMKRSEILSEIIKTAGLTPVIDVKGLDDDVTSFDNVSSNSSDKGSSSDLAGGEGEEVDSLVAKIVGSETNDLKKAILIHDWLKANVRYSGYACSHYSSAAECIKNAGHLNCADTARLTRAMMASAGLTCWVAHHSEGPGHFWTVIEIDGKKYTSDQTGDGSEWDTVWYPSGRTSSGGTGGNYDANNGKNPSC